jgi:hypothetical protein
VRAGHDAASVGGEPDRATEESPVEDEQSESRIAKIVGLVAAAGASWLAGKLIERVWRTAFGHTPPKADDAAEDIRFAEVVAAAALSGALIGVFRASATRGARKLVS